MATVELSFTALPAHVRTARLVATAVARRSGVDESLLDEVRLAVGEACSRAVEGHQMYCPTEPVRLALTDLAGRFEVEVTDNCAADSVPAGSGRRAGSAGPCRFGPRRPEHSLLLDPTAACPELACLPRSASPSSRASLTMCRSARPRLAPASG